MFKYGHADKLWHKIGNFVLLHKGKMLCQSLLAASRESFMPSLPCCTAREDFMPMMLA
jgi:hypothetical protein